ncbi:MAG: polymer-forming cytoskeletal protein [Treponema sp.]|jgi:cytoskeletal protein CcmA (bactofilin family)|nr:polymer-forming cytoskeletal protein [Treponema sp.]MBR2106054.1 polymer-forming cytoskeletal protein [Treponema sp.]
MALRIDDISINTVIGKGSEIKGNIKVNGVVRIDGDIDGNLETDGNVIIGENARIRGNINAKSIIVGGIILGNIFANESVKVLANSIVIGDILSHKVQIEDDALVNGKCISIRNEENYTMATSKYLQSKAIIEKASI